MLLHSRKFVHVKRRIWRRFVKCELMKYCSIIVRLREPGTSLENDKKLSFSLLNYSEVCLSVCLHFCTSVCLLVRHNLRQGKYTKSKIKIFDFKILILKLYCGTKINSIKVITSLGLTAQNYIYLYILYTYFIYTYI